MRHLRLDTPIGELLLEGDGRAVVSIHLPRYRGRPPATTADSLAAGRDDAVLAAAAEQLGRYFAGTLREFDLPLAPRGSDFQQRVWDELRRIPFGATTSYGAIARTLDLPDAARAVGAANGANPIPIVVPCHRVVGANGSLTGFGGGIECKRWLLAHESRIAGLDAFA